MVCLRAAENLKQVLRPRALWAASPAVAANPGLVGYWLLRGDRRDQSGHGLDGINHDVELKAAAFSGRRASIKVPDAPLVQFGRGEYSITADVFTYQGIDGFFGDSFSKF
jgi:hypothetical protein